MMTKIVSITKPGESMNLSKEIDQNKEDGSFRQLLEYMLDAEGDGMNKPYDANERELVEAINFDYNEGNNENFNLCYISSENENPLDVNLDDIVKDQDNLYHQRNTQVADKDAEYQEMFLLCSSNMEGGY
ncbi:MAG: hypothetical protein ACQER9_02505 [Nanobdellota archaeon]